jgi:serine/threonine protein phosphatase 1
MGDIMFMKSKTETITYVVGDIYGMADPFVGLLKGMIKDAQSKSATPRFIFLGNVIGRGEESATVLEAVIGLLHKFPGSKLIMGQQERMFLSLLQGTMSDRDFRHWLYQGGKKTLAAYGFEGFSTPRDEMQLDIIENFPEHLAALLYAPSHVVEGDYCFVHAGIRPSVSLADQTAEDMATIGDAFLNSEDRFEKIIVHGHHQTWHTYPEVLANRVALGGAGFIYGRLAALVFEQGRPTRFMLNQPGAPMKIEQYPFEQFHSWNMTEAFSAA